MTETGVDVLVVFALILIGDYPARKPDSTGDSGHSTGDSGHSTGDSGHSTGDSGH